MSSDDEDILKSKKFIEVELPKDFDPNQPHRNGEEYLRWVMYQKLSTPAVITAKLDFSKFSKNQTLSLLNEDNENYKIPAKDLPNAEWQASKLADFREFRKYVQAQLPEVRTGHRSPTSYSAQMNQIYPDLSRVSNLSTIQLLKVISKIVEQLVKVKNGQMFNDFLGSWILTALTLIDDPIICDMAFIVREVCKECMRIRYHLYLKNGEAFIGGEATPLNMFICIITKHFLQKDLCEA